jgi:hypothetical protein
MTDETSAPGSDRIDYRQLCDQISHETAQGDQAPKAAHRFTVTGDRGEAPRDRDQELSRRWSLKKTTL